MKPEPQNLSFEEIAGLLAGRGDDDRDQLPPEDHRAAVYAAAARHPDLHDAALAHLAQGDDDLWARTVALQLFYAAMDLSASGWSPELEAAYSALPVDDYAREKVDVRRRELPILREVVLDGERTSPRFTDDAVSAWSHWLQREAAERAVDKFVLEALVRVGPRKIRNVAQRRLGQ